MSDAAARPAALAFQVLMWEQPPSAVRRAQPSCMHCLCAIVASPASPSPWKSGPFAAASMTKNLRSL